MARKPRRRRVELKTRKPLPGKVGGPMTSKKGKRGYDRRRQKELDQEEVAVDEENS